MKLITKGTVARIGAKINKPVAKIATPHSSTPITFNQRGKLCVLKVAGKRSIPAKEFKPKPAGAEIRESLRSRPLFKRFIQLGRDTSSCRVLG